MKIIAMIPARMGSTRLKRKNLSLINGKPMIAYAIEAAKAAGVFDQIIVNSEHPDFSQIAQKYGVDFYQRPEALGSSTTKSDDVVFDFMEKNPGDITVWVNSIAPLQTSSEIKNVVEYFLKNQLDSLITTALEQVHCLFDGKPLNFKQNEIFAQTQDLTPIERFVYSIMMWRNECFQSEYQKTGHSIFCGKFGSYPVSRLSSLLVKTEEDYLLIDAIARGLESNSRQKATYLEIPNEAKS